MRKPDQSLDDFTVKPNPEVFSEPPRPVSLRSTGEVEIVKPVPAAPRSSRRFRPKLRHQPLWFRRFIVAGGSVLVMMAMVLISAILVAISESRQSYRASQMEVGDGLIETNEPFDILSAAEASALSIDLLPPAGKPSKPRAQVASYRPRRDIRPVQIAEPQFIPTTLVIYTQNGEVKTRIEPWRQSS